MVPSGIEDSIFRETRNCERSDFGIDADAFVFALYASFYRVKNHAMAIAAFERVARLDKRPILVLFGDPGDPIYFTQISTRVASSRYSSRNQLRGFIDLETVAVTLKNIVHVSLLPTLHEGCGNAALEAIYCGVPVIMTETGLAPELRALYPKFMHVINQVVSPDQLSPELINDLSIQPYDRNVEELAGAMRKLVGDRKPKQMLNDFPFTKDRW